MSEESNTQRLLDEAERAAAAGDLASADLLLRNAAHLQEAELGPQHPELANTLSNLAIVAEKTGRHEDAETSYRRAAAIASASLPPDHPTVAETRKNLEDFCRERNLPVEALPQPAVPPTVVRSTQRRTLSWAAAIVIAAAVAAALFATRETAPPEAPSVATTPPASPASPKPVDPQPRSTMKAPPNDRTTGPDTARNGTRRRPAPTANRRAAAPPPRISLAEAQLCQTLSTTGRNWRCNPAREPASRGRLVLLTRVKSPGSAVVVHRWYRGGVLQQSVRLPVRASAAGYRTYSRQTINTAGRWRVEIRNAGGDLLYQKSFAVR